MSQRTSSSGLGSLLGLLAVVLIVVGLIYVYKEHAAEEPKKEPPKPKVVEKQGPATSTTDDISNLLGLGDGTLGSSTVKASDLGKATSISGGVKVGSSSSKSSTRRSTRRSSGSTRRSGG